jgi:hypothetical protein
VIEGIFNNQPAAHAEETDDRGDEYQQAEDAAGVPDVNARRRVGGRETILKSHLRADAYLATFDA